MEDKSKEFSIQDWGFDDNDTNNSKKRPPRLDISKLNQKEILKFAKYTLVTIVLLFIGISTALMLYPQNEGVNKVWSFASVALNTIVSLILGYYFGKRI